MYTEVKSVYLFINAMDRIKYPCLKCNAQNALHKSYTYSNSIGCCAMCIVLLRNVCVLLPKMMYEIRLQFNVILKHQHHHQNLFINHFRASFSHLFSNAKASNCLFYILCVCLSSCSSTIHLKFIQFAYFHLFICIATFFSLVM